VTLEVLLKNDIFYFSGEGGQGGEKRWRTIFERSSSNVRCTDPSFPAALSVSSSLKVLRYNAPYTYLAFFYINTRCTHIYIYINNLIIKCRIRDGLIFPKSIFNSPTEKYRYKECRGKGEGGGRQLSREMFLFLVYSKRRKSDSTSSIESRTK